MSSKNYRKHTDDSQISFHMLLFFLSVMATEDQFGVFMQNFIRSSIKRGLDR